MLQSYQITTHGKGLMPPTSEMLPDPPASKTDRLSLFYYNS